MAGGRTAIRSRWIAVLVVVWRLGPVDVLAPRPTVVPPAFDVGGEDPDSALGRHCDELAGVDRGVDVPDRHAGQGGVSRSLTVVSIRAHPTREWCARRQHLLVHPDRRVDQIRGLLVALRRTVWCWPARNISATKAISMAGQVFIPRDKIAMIQLPLEASAA
jgi:hypothetical protein